MAMVVNSVVIARPRQVVFDYLSDPRSELDWNPGVRMMEKVTDGPLAVGSRFRARWRNSPVVELTITRYDRPEGWAYSNDGPVSMDFQATLDDVGGLTRLTCRSVATPHGPMRLAFPIFLRALRKDQRRNMALIQSRLESM